MRRGRGDKDGSAREVVSRRTILRAGVAAGVTIQAP